MFNDNIKQLDIKSTDEQRYGAQLEILKLSKDHVIDDWNTIFKNKVNKKQFKELFTDHIMQICGSHMESNMCIYINGTFGDGRVVRVEKLESGYTKMEMMENLTLTMGESDTKIFQP